MIRYLEALLSMQDPTQPHTLLTRLVVSFCVCLVCIVLYGFYGLIAAIVVYLFGVELMGLPANWALYSFMIGLLIGCWNSILSIRDYWKGYGYGES